MSRIAGLINDLAPQGVPYKQVGSIATVGTGSSDRQDATDDGQYPFYVRSNDVMRKGSYEFDEEAVLIPGEGGIGEIFHYVNGKYALHQRAYRISFKGDAVLAKFAYYYFIANFKTFILEKAVSATVTSIRKPMIEDFSIPIPPIEVQREIIRLLDLHTDLRAELQEQLRAESAARQKQHEFVASRIIANIHGERVTLRELGNWRGGVTPSKSDLRYWKSGTIPWLASMDVSESDGKSIRGRVTSTALAETSLRVIPSPAVVVVMRSNILRRRLPVGLTSVETTVNQDVKALAPRDNVDPEYVYQVLKVTSEDIRTACVRLDGSMAAVDSKAFLDWSIPLPAVQDQKRIARQLSALDALLNELKTNLSTELVLRNSQYKYYRDKLLTFQEAVA